MANRLSGIVPKIIGQRQTTFIGERQIINGVVVANEIIDDARKRRRRCAIFKVDFLKAYDSVCWEYLLGNMARMGFCQKWCKWVELCLKSALVSVLVNGSPTEQFQTEKGYSVGDSGISVSMLQFADDTLFGDSGGGSSSSSRCNLDAYVIGFTKEIPMKVIHMVERVQRDFLWGSCPMNRKVASVNRKKCAKLKRWRLLNEEGELWYVVLKAKYYVGGKEVWRKARHVSEWWREIWRVDEGEGSRNGWLGKLFCIRTGNGGKTRFWHNVWSRDQPLKQDVEDNYDGMVTHQGNIQSRKHIRGIYNLKSVLLDVFESKTAKAPNSVNYVAPSLVEKSFCFCLEDHSEPLTVV
ncbi:uncharacterized protein LOC113859792 [Abrus precatorius]|uniref:Uncharacterized protein LOC113859792 n=1 Tax=Abrus precatorius TaxID=3816 RepID=A0A8B8L0W1_ABRPR|nr:uncharacterized protein LOC113859792 [Abrus precatorius]